MRTALGKGCLNGRQADNKGSARAEVNAPHRRRSTHTPEHLSADLANRTSSNTPFRSTAGSKFTAVLTVGPVTCLLTVQDLQEGVVLHIAKEKLGVNGSGAAVKCPKAGNNITVWKNTDRMTHAAADVGILLVTRHEVVEVHLRLVTNRGGNPPFPAPCGHTPHTVHRSWQPPDSRHLCRTGRSAGCSSCPRR